jgi:excisionase family DNA binding protein
METLQQKLAAYERPITVEELCELLTINNETVYDWIKGPQRLPAYRLGKFWRFEPCEILAWWNARKVGR